jgi:LDH2 family malate/lactate/ureidoglycolate dehydrogenase
MHINFSPLIQNFSYASILQFTESVFLRTGFTAQDAELSARLLTRADIRGIDSHGVARLCGYVRLIKAGRLNPTPNFQWSGRFPVLKTLDADQSIGFVSAHAAMSKCISMAESFGCGMVAVNNSNHFGIAGQYALMAAEKGLVGMAFTNASPLVAPTHSLDRMLGTNPIAVAIPSQMSEPFVLDMATTTAANGKLEILQRKNQEAPSGWIQKSDGTISKDPNELKSGGALRPLGSFEDLGSHKGYGLGSMVDIFSGVLSGANFGPWVPPFVAFLPLAAENVGKGIGHFFIAFRPDGFIEQEQFLERMEKWMTTFRSSQKIGDENVMVPGDPEWALEQQRMAEGIPLLPAVVDDLNQLAAEFGLSKLVSI